MVDFDKTACCHISYDRTLSHYGGVDEPIPKCCLKLKIPIIDSTTISGNDIFKATGIFICVS